MKSHRTRWVAVASLALLPTIATASARADTCPPLDPTCVVGDVVESGGSAVDDTVETVDGTTGLDVGGTIDAMPPVDGGNQPPIDDGGGTGTTGAGNDSGRWNHGDGDVGSKRRGNAAATRGAGPSSSPAIGGRAAAPRGPSTVPAVHQLRQAASMSDRLAAVAVGAAKSLAVVLGLMGAAVAFVLIQNRLDGKDPRLALAPHRSDVVSFG